MDAMEAHLRATYGPNYDYLEQAVLQGMMQAVQKVGPNPTPGQQEWLRNRLEDIRFKHENNCGS